MDGISISLFFERWRVWKAGAERWREPSFFMNLEILTGTGWLMQPSTIYEWNSYFANLVLSLPVSLESSDDVLHLFTDGSCHQQHATIDRRLVGFSVVRATTTGIHDFTGAQLLDPGPLPGLCRVE